MKSTFIGITISALFTLGSCNSGSQQNDHHNEMESEKGHDHATMEENHGKMDNEEEMHRQHESIRDNFAHKDIIILDNPYQAGQATDKDLQEVVKTYLALKNAFIKEDLNEVNRSAANMAEKVKSVDTQSFKDEGEKAWAQHASLYSDKLVELQHVQGLEEKRSYFSHISEIVYCTVKSFGLKDDVELYVAFCPMAFDGTGAYWITDSKEIQNPYLGSKMPECGKIEEQL